MAMFNSFLYVYQRVTYGNFQRFHHRTLPFADSSAIPSGLPPRPVARLRASSFRMPGDQDFRPEPRQPRGFILYIICITCVLKSKIVHTYILYIYICVYCVLCIVHIIYNVCIYIYMYVYVCVYIYMYVCIYIYIYCIYIIYVNVSCLSMSLLEIPRIAKTAVDEQG